MAHRTCASNWVGWSNLTVHFLIWRTYACPFWASRVALHRSPTGFDHQRKHPIDIVWDSTDRKPPSLGKKWKRRLESVDTYALQFAMEIVHDLLDSWDRQCKIVNSVTSLIDDDNRHIKPSDDGWSLDRHLAHMHGTRRFFLSQVAPEHAADLVSASSDTEGTPLADLDAIKACLEASGKAVRNAVQAGIEKGGPMAGGHVVYDNPTLFLQHLVWHEGWHAGLIFLALRLNGQEPPEEWEETNVWGQWRKETW